LVWQCSNRSSTRRQLCRLWLFHVFLSPKTWWMIWSQWVTGINWTIWVPKLQLGGLSPITKWSSRCSARMSKEHTTVQVHLTLRNYAGRLLRPTGIYGQEDSGPNF
jgi:hypothetical protein